MNWLAGKNRDTLKRSTPNVSNCWVPNSCPLMGYPCTSQFIVFVV